MSNNADPTKLPTEITIQVDESDVIITDKWLIVTLTSVADALLGTMGISRTKDRFITIPAPAKTKTVTPDEPTLPIG